ncbi:MAG TPA: outer membrane lipoprotein-sorting protein [Vicinamibacterales bacterium]|jgi:hypothetical protein
MSRPVHCFLILLFLNTGAGNEFFSTHATARDARGEWLARQIEDRDRGKDARLSLRMRLYDRQERARERVLTLISMRGGPGRPVPGDRTLIRFSYPNDIKGTAFLVWESASGDDDRFLYLPSLGRVRRIAGSESQESFVGSDFTYEDIGGREFEEYTYTMLSETETWKAPDGSSHPAYRLESRRRDANARFPRVVSIVRKDNFVVVHAEIFDKRDEKQKTFDALRLEKTGGYWTVLEMRMVDARERTRTDLVIENVEYDVGLKPDDFSRRELERSGRLSAEGAPATPRRSSKRVGGGDG